MGELNSFHINDDGSVTVEQQLTEQERNILDIFKIEKSKGGTFVSRRMKIRAIKYAKSVNYPEFKVDKLMLDYYPEEFSAQGKYNIRLTALILSILFLLGGIICGICVIALLEGNFDHYIRFPGTDFTLLFIGSIVGIILGLGSLKWYKSVEPKNCKSIN